MCKSLESGNWEGLCLWPLKKLQQSSSLEKKYKEMSNGSNYVLFIQFFFNIIYAHLEFEASNVFQKDQARQQKY